ncbi:uncharacterized protein LOC113493999 [Trichoplusia ni]|uniref:Uncharacterized protein LOC113493999 n=1 Tax=Trichoplusia ni TaxID=7111 RepID=A0A7E5VI73_TRINI|nr:uncharacterized protein LOC113493999 [Trichoplusia ni]
MERDEIDKTSAVGTLDDVDSRCAVNSLILDYYKKFGRKRDLEQFFSLSTAQSEIKDTSGLFWRKMKSENDSSDSGGGRKSDSSHEVCRISIRCSVPDASTSQDDDNPRTKTDFPQTESPPIIIEEVPADTSRHTDDDSINFDDNNSQKSFDALLDLSAHKPLSPTSSITSQRKLEWDSLADVGYANESDRKTSASSLSTLERLALKQQYSNNDSKQDIGIPTSHSTPLDEEGKAKSKKGVGKKTTKIYKKDVDLVEVNVPHSSNAAQAQSINVNLTKHISFNVEKDGGITIENVKRDVSFSPEKGPERKEVLHPVGTDKEIQTTLTKDDPLVKIDTNKLISEIEIHKPLQDNQKIPVLISLNTLRKKLRRKKSRTVYRRKKTKKKKEENKENTPQEKSGEPLSEAESFEYMPGHMYNQNQNKVEEQRPDNSTGNKSSLESSQAFTTDSSKGSKHSLTKDLEKCIDLLKVTLQQRYDDNNTKKKLIKDIVHRLITSKYRDDDSTTEFLSGLSYTSRKTGLKGNNTTTSTSDTNNTDDNIQKKPKKSILRNDKFNPNNIASTSQSAPNLFTASNENVNTNLIKTLTMTDSDASSKGKTSSDVPFPKTSSEELYLKYLEALRREESYKRHLRDKQMFMKQKLVSSEPATVRQEPKISSRLKDLMKDLTRNNYDDGSGDASKLEGGSTSNVDLDRLNTERTQRSHSVFTLSSSQSEGQKRPNLKKKMQAEREIGEAGPSRDHYCCCPHHFINSKVGYTDSSVQVNIKYQCEDEETQVKSYQPKTRACTALPNECNKCKAELKTARVVPDNVTGEIRYVCLCNRRPASSNEVVDNVIYKCSKLTNRGIQLESPRRLYNTGVQCSYATPPTKDDDIEMIQPPCRLNTGTDSSSDNTNRRYSKSSQTNMLIKMMCRGDDDFSSLSEVKNLCGTSTKLLVPAENAKKAVTIREATRCLQTEISLDPKMSDPKLSDIVIVSDCECSKLVSEQLRHICPDKTDSSYKRKTFSDMCTSSTSGKLLIESEESLFTDERISSKSCKDDATYDFNRVPNKPPVEAYPIPIQGTNMTLMVNLGAMEVMTKKKQVDQGVATECAVSQDEATSGIHECKKSAQCSCSIDQSTNNTCSKHSTYNRKPCIRKTSPENSSKSNTYPKKDPVKDKPPFKRSNTDTGKIGVTSCTQTDKVKEDAETGYNRGFCVPEKERLIICCHCENRCQMHTCEKGETVNNKEGSNKKARKDSPESDRDYIYREKETDKRTEHKHISCDTDGFKNKEKDTRDRSVSPPSKSYDVQIKETETKTKICTCDNACQVERNDEKIVIDKDKYPSKDISDGQDSEKSYILDKKYSDDEITTKKTTRDISSQIEKSDEKTVIEKERYPSRDKSDNLDCEKTSILKNKFSDDEKATKKCTCDNSSQVETKYDKKVTSTFTSENKYCEETGILKNKCSDDEKSTKKCTCDKSSQVERKYEEKETNKYPKDGSENPFCEKTGILKHKCSDDEKTTKKCTCDSSSQVERNDEEKVTDKHRRPSKDRSESSNSDKSVVSKNTLPDDEKTTKKHTCDSACQGIIESDSATNKGDKVTKDKPKSSNNNKTGNNKRRLSFSDDEPTSKTSCETSSQSNKTENRKIDTQIRSESPNGSPTVKIDVAIQNNVCADELDKKIIKKISDTYKPVLKDCSQMTCRNVGCDTQCGGKCLNVGCQTDVPDRDTPQNARKTEPNEPKTSQDDIQTDDTKESDKDPILDIIQDMTRRYSKNDLVKLKKKKCFTEIVAVLNYLLETEDSTDPEPKTCCSTSQSTTTKSSLNKTKRPTVSEVDCCSEKQTDKGLNRKSRKDIKDCTESSDLPCSTDMPTSSDSTACRVLNKIKKECEKYHQKRCKSGRKCEISSSTSVSCDKCQKIHYCSCKSHKCKRSKALEKLQKKCVAYNLIIKNSESVVSEETVFKKPSRPLQNIIVTVPKRGAKNDGKDEQKCEQEVPSMSPRFRLTRSRSLTRQSVTNFPSVREYLEQNRPDFVENSLQRQNCLKFISERRASARAAQRDLLSLHMEQQPDLTALNADDLRKLARDIGLDLRRKKPVPKLISEREMKKRSEKIYKTLPEVVQKKEQKKKENIKKTNLLMANIFKKNLQKQALRGTVNLSNYNTVIKI